MRRVIDLCLDMPPDALYLSNTLSTFCLDPAYEGYKKNYGQGMAAQIGYTIEQLDDILLKEGKEVFKQKISLAADKYAVKPKQFVEHLDKIGVSWGITCDNNHDNKKTAEIVSMYPDRFKGFIFVDPNKGMDAVRELETCVKIYGLHALYITGFRTKLPANDKKNYPLYAKACELNIPVHIYSSVNLSAAVPYDIGHPRYIDEVARDFPELKIMAAVSGFPWVLEFITLALRHKNVYLNFETHPPKRIGIPGSGYDPYLYYAENSIQDRLCFASNWTTQCQPLEDIIDQVEKLPFSDITKDKILFQNAERFWNNL